MKTWLRVRLRSLLVAVALLALVFAYVGSYHRLSRRSMREGSDYGLPGILYVPMEEAAATRDLSWHYCLAAFYAPANWFDRQFFGGKPPAVCIMWSLSG